MKTLKQYLLEVQEAGIPIGDIEAIKAQYRKRYAAIYRKDYSKFKRRLELTLTLDEHEKVKSAAAASRMRIGPFAVRLIFAALHNTPVPQGREDLVNQVVAATRRAGNLINQMVRKSHQKDELYLEDILACQRLLQDLEVQVVGILTEPRDIVSEVKTSLERSPELAHVLAAIVLEHLHKQGNGNHIQ